MEGRVKGRNTEINEEMKLCGEREKEGVTGGYWIKSIKEKVDL